MTSMVFVGFPQNNVFFAQRFEGSASDAGSKSSYGTRELEVIDQNLHSDSDCDKRAETLLYQKMNPPIQLEITVPGNTNVLVGDRLSMTIPAENISSANYDVLSVEHNFSESGFLTKAIMVNSANIREPIESDPIRSLINIGKLVHELSFDQKTIK